MSGSQLLVLGIIITAAALTVLLTTINAIRSIYAPQEQPVKIIQCKDLHHTVVEETDPDDIPFGEGGYPHGERTQVMPIIPERRRSTSRGMDA
jgi:hypothetical protein